MTDVHCSVSNLSVGTQTCGCGDGRRLGRTTPPSSSGCPASTTPPGRSGPGGGCRSTTTRYTVGNRSGGNVTLSTSPSTPACVGGAPGRLACVRALVSLNPLLMRTRLFLLDFCAWFVSRLCCVLLFVPDVMLSSQISILSVQLG